MALVSALAIFAAACSGSNEAASGGTLRIAAIPDQEPERLARTYDLVSDYLAEALDVEVDYVPVTDYTGAVSARLRRDLR